MRNSGHYLLDAINADMYFPCEDTGEVQAAVELAFDSLHQDTRKILTMRFQEEKSVEEIAKIAGVESHIIRELLWNDLTRLRQKAHDILYPALDE